jgi:hypothetical protein
LAHDDALGPAFAPFHDTLPESFDIPGVSGRVSRRLTQRIKRALECMRSRRSWDERERVVALSGLLAARVLDVRLPRSRSGRTLYEEYDLLMRRRGLREEFSSAVVS